MAGDLSLSLSTHIKVRYIVLVVVMVLLLILVLGRDWIRAGLIMLKTVSWYFFFYGLMHLIFPTNLKFRYSPHFTGTAEGFKYAFIECSTETTHSNFIVHKVCNATVIQILQIVCLNPSSI